MGIWGISDEYCKANPVPPKTAGESQLYAQQSSQLGVHQGGMGKFVQGHEV